jgi:putative membrane protein
MGKGGESMFGSEFFDFPLWWIFPLIMIFLCFFMMRGRMSSMMCGHGEDREDSHRITPSDSALDILDKRYAQGEIEREEYEQKKRDLTHH